MVQFIPIAVVPQVFFAGIFPLENMADWLQSIGKIMPVHYAADALKAVMYKGIRIEWILVVISLHYRIRIMFID